MRENDRGSTSAVSGSYTGHYGIYQGEGDPLLHLPSNYNISYEARANAMYTSGGHPCDCNGYALRCHCHCNNFYHLIPRLFDAFHPDAFGGCRKWPATSTGEVHIS